VSDNDFVFDQLSDVSLNITEFYSSGFAKVMGLVKVT
jgi:hypothetical protein